MRWEAITLVALVLLAFVAFSGCTNEPEPQTCTEEAKLCPDGVTSVGRNPALNCEFDPCPIVQANSDEIPMPTDTGETDEVPELPL